MEIDIYDIFKSYDVRGKVGTQLTPTTVKDIARAFADWLPTKGVIAVGHDMRADSKALAEAFMSGLQQQGYDVWDIGLVTSDMIYFAVGKYELAGGAVITASHNPGDDNGIKLYRDKVVAVGLDAGLDEIRDKVLAKKFKSSASKSGKRIPRNITRAWIEHCLSFISELKPFSIAIDAGNGMAGAILPHILPKLPFRAEKMYFELDGNFPNHEANPQKHENLQDLIRMVTENRLDFGIAFDGDGDRAVFVDDLGRPVLGTDIISLLAKFYLNKYPGSKVVHDVRTSRATEELIREWGGEPIRTKAGRVNIGSLMRKVQAPLGGETTGHMFFKENYDADSGLIAALVTMQSLSDTNQKMSDLVNEYRRYVMMPEMNIEMVGDKSSIFERLEQAFGDGKIDKMDGLTVWFDNYWFNLRASNTEQVMRLNAEAITKEQLDGLVSQIMQVMNDVQT